MKVAIVSPGLDSEHGSVLSHLLLLQDQAYGAVWVKPLLLHQMASVLALDLL